MQQQWRVFLMNCWNGRSLSDLNNEHSCIKNKAIELTIENFYHVSSISVTADHFYLRSFGLFLTKVIKIYYWHSSTQAFGYFINLILPGMQLSYLGSRKKITFIILFMKFLSLYILFNYQNNGRDICKDPACAQYFQIL